MMFIALLLQSKPARVVGEFHVIQQGMQEGTGHDDGGKQTCDNAQSQRDGEAFDHACSKAIAEDVKDETGDQRGGV